MSTDPNALIQPHMDALVDPSQSYRYEGRWPNPEDLIRYGGLPGVEYALVPGDRLGPFTSGGWQLLPGAPIVTVVGPLGACDNILVIGTGSPTRGADPSNGVRRWYVHREVEMRTGLSAAGGPLEVTVGAPEAAPPTDDATVSIPPAEASAVPGPSSQEAKPPVKSRSRQTGKRE